VGVHATTASAAAVPEDNYPVYLPSSPLSSAQRVSSSIRAPRCVQRMCSFFSIRHSTSWSPWTRLGPCRWDALLSRCTGNGTGKNLGVLSEFP